MSSDLPDNPNKFETSAANIEHVRVEDEMEQSYIDYAMSVIAGRALPDVRDGLKPVHRRILYAMHEMGVTPGSGHRKSSSIVGETMGDYHPHGDSAIYNTLVRMAQEFSLRYPLVDGQGNFGSMDGDPPAAMRYTEARMAPIAEELLEDIGKETVDFQSNYDDRLTEPEVLPAKLPNLLLNGSSGIAVGMSTNVPPHNLSEIVDAVVHLAQNPDCEVSDLMEYVEGPDFPTGANIVGREAIYSAYATGRGRLRMRAEYDLVRRESGADRIVITELPYQENKARIVERIADDVKEGVIEGVSDLRDESDRNGVRIVVDLKRGANADVVENQLLESHLESTFGVINLALVDGQPRVLNLKETLEHYLEHRKDVVRRRSQHDLREAQDRAHILEGRLEAVERAEAIVDVVTETANRDQAQAVLEGAVDPRGIEDIELEYPVVQSSFGFSEQQAAHILRMQIGSLTSMEANEIRTEYEEVQERIEYLQSVLASEEKLLGVITDELRELEAEYGDERRTSIMEAEDEVTHEDLIPEEDCLVVLTEEDYIKRMPAAEFDPQRRGGKGIIGADPKEGDRVSTVFMANTHDYLLCFTNQGQVYRVKTYEIPEMSRNARGKSAVNVIDLDDGEEITAVVDTDAFAGDECLTMVTREGYIKRTCAADFENIRSTGLIAATIDDDDALVDVEVTDRTGDLVVATEDGMTIRFAESEVREMGRSARGVRAIDLQDGDRVAGVVATNDADERALLTVTRNGYGKRTPLAEYRRQSRYGKGLVDIDTGQRNGRVATVKAVTPNDDLIVMSERGQIMRTTVDEISTQGRNTMGVTVMNLEPGDRVTSVTLVPGDE
jgi:DNA gyrase subunit A